MRNTATLTDLRLKTAEVMRPVQEGHEVTITDHGQPCAKIIPIPKVDRKAALAALRAIGPLELPPRK